MRPHIYILAIIIFVCGCSAIISSRGQFGDVLTYDTTRQTIHARLGPPVRTVTTNYPASGSFDTYDVFLKRGKVYRPLSDFEEFGYLDFWTLGLYEIYGTPKAIAQHIKARSSFHEITVHYYTNDIYSWHEIHRIENAK